MELRETYKPYDYFVYGQILFAELGKWTRKSDRHIFESAYDRIYPSDNLIHLRNCKKSRDLLG